MKSFLIVLAISSLSLQGIGSVVSERQVTEEGSLMRGIRAFFQFYQIKHDGSLPTNWAMLNEEILPEGWRKREKQFREFGELKGFTNSIYEKYVFINPGLPISLRVMNPEARLSPLEESPILFMSASSVPAYDGLYRYVVYQQGSNLYSDSIKEDKIQKAFAKANRQIPIPPPALTTINAAEEAAEAERERENEKALEKFKREHPEDFTNEIPRQEGRRSSRLQVFAGSNIVSTNASQLAPAELGTRRSVWLWLGFAVIVGLGIAFIRFRREKKS